MHSYTVLYCIENANQLIVGYVTKLGERENLSYNFLNCKLVHIMASFQFRGLEGIQLNFENKNSKIELGSSIFNKEREKKNFHHERDKILVQLFKHFICITKDK